MPRSKLPPQAVIPYDELSNRVNPMLIETQDLWKAHIKLFDEHSKLASDCIATNNNLQLLSEQSPGSREVEQQWKVMDSLHEKALKYNEGYESFAISQKKLFDFIQEFAKKSRKSISAIFRSKDEARCLDEIAHLEKMFQDSFADFMLLKETFIEKRKLLDAMMKEFYERDS